MLPSENLFPYYVYIYKGGMTSFCFVKREECNKSKKNLQMRTHAAGVTNVVWEDVMMQESEGRGSVL